MSSRPPARTRTTSRLRRWLRHAWVSRLDLLAWCRGLGEWLRGPDEHPKARRPGLRPDMELLETRETPDDMLGLLQTPLVLGGVPLIFGTLRTPGGAFLRGWSGGTAAAPAEAPTASGVPGNPLDAGLSAAEVSGLLSAWQPSPVVAAAGGPGAPDAGPVFVAQPGTRPALPVGATGLEPLRMAGLPSTAEDLLNNPLGDDWLSSVEAAVEAARRRRAGPPAPDDHGGGGGGSGDSGPGSPFPDHPGGGTGGANPSAHSDGVPALPALQPGAPGGPGAVAPPAPAPPGAPPSVSGGAGVPPARVPSGARSPALGPTPAAPGGPAQPLTDQGGVSSPTPVSLLQNYGQAPLPFEPNVGQTDPQALYVSHGPGLTLFLTGAGATFEVPRTPQSPNSDLTRDVFDLSFAGANPQPQVVPQNDLLSRSNYFVGDDPTQWQTNVPQYGEVDYRGLYPGIDLAYHGAPGRQLEYDFTVAPGADLSAIQLAWQGLQSVSLDGQGDLLLTTAGGNTVVQQPAVMYQMINGSRQPVSGRYTLLGRVLVGFQADAYDHSLPLVIDPVLAYSSYLGGSGNDYAYAVAVDNNGNAYVAGSTLSLNFPTTTGAFLTTGSSQTLAFVTKLNQTGTSPVYSTYLGLPASNNYGCYASGIAVDGAGEAVVVGRTLSSPTSFPGFPTTPGAFQTVPKGPTNAFVTKLAPAGDGLIASSLITGSNSQTASGVALDPSGGVYVTGWTNSSDFPTTSGAYQTQVGGTQTAFVLKLGSALSGAGYSTLLGGLNPDSSEGTAVAVDPLGCAYVTGNTSSGFPTTGGAFQTTAPSSDTPFVAKLNPAGTALLYSTFLGGSSGNDQSTAIALTDCGCVDDNFSAYVTGVTSSTDFPLASAYQSTLNGTSDAFVSVVNDTGSGLVYSTYLGGWQADQGNGVAVDSQGYATVTGYTASTDFPTTSGAFQTSLAGSGLLGVDAFVTRLSPAGGLDYSTFLGGTGDDKGAAVGLDPQGNAYVAGYTTSTNFPTVSPAQSSNAGGYDAFVAKVLPLNPPAPAITGVSPDTGLSSADKITTAQNVTLSGVAAASSTVTISRRGVGVIGTAPAGGGGAWTFDYSGTTLPEGGTTFNATDSRSGVVSDPSGEFLVTVDRTAPAVTLTAPATTPTRAPQVRVTASDLNGLPSPGGLYPGGVTVTLDVDLNDNGSFTDPGETGYATATLVDGVALITVPTLPGAGTYPMRARLSDLAGNQGTSATVNVVVSSVTSWGTDSTQVLTVDPGGGQAQDQLGDVNLGAPLDLDQSPGTVQSGDPALVYNSDAVSVRPIVQVSVPSANNAALPSTVSTQLTFNGVAGGTMTYSTSGLSPGDTFVLASQSPTTITTTGRYGWSLTVAVPGQTTQVLTGAAYVVTQDGSPFGAGWTFSPVDTLVNVPADANGPAGQLRVYGTGEWRFYQDLGGGAFQSPAGDSGTLSQTGGTFTYSTPDGRTWTFNSSGQETSWASADGNETLQFRYSGGLLVGMTAVDGGLSTFSYSGGLLQTIQTVNSRTTSFAYSGGNLSQVTNPDGGTHAFSYDGNHHLTGETFAGLRNSWVYSSAGTLADFVWGSGTGASTTVYSPAIVQGLSAPSAAGAQAPATDADGHTTRWLFDAQGRPTQVLAADGGLSQHAYSNGFLTAATDPLGRTTTYALDSKGYATVETLPGGSTVTMQYQSAFHALTTYTDERGYNTTYTYDGQGHQLTATNALGQTTSYAYNGVGLLTKVTDPLGHATSYAYDSARRLTTATDPLGDTTTYAYDANGNQLRVTDARGNTTTTSYDVMGRLTAVTDALGETTSYAYDASGLQLTVTDALGRVTATSYDSRGLVTLTAYPDASDTLLTYDAAGQQAGSRNPDGWWTTQAYDPAGRPLTTTNSLAGQARQFYDPAGQALEGRDELGRWTQSAFSARGWSTQGTDALGDVSTMAYDAAGDLTSSTDPLSHTQSYQYDALARQTVATDALSHSVTTTYDAAGNVSTVTDPNGHVTSYAYDAANRRTAATEAVGTPVQETQITGYDPVGNATTQTDGLGHTVTYVYDKLNRLVAVHDPLNHVTTTAYDAVGNVTATVDGLGEVTSYAYDAMDRQTAVTDPLGNTTTTVFDRDGNVVAVIDPMGHETRYGYDPLDRQVLMVDGECNVTRYAYDAAGNRVAVTDPDGNVTAYVFDGLNRIVKETDPLGDVTTTAYDAAGRTTSVTDRDGRTQLFSYDAADRLTAATWLSSGSATVNLVTYGYDPKGNLLTAADYHGTVSSSYDALDRATSYANVFGQVLTYSYGAADRLTLRTDSLGGVLTSVYDAAGRLTSRQFGGSGLTQARADLGYTSADQLSSVTRFSDVAGTTLVGTTAYAYDAASRLTAITNKSGSGATLSYYDNAYDPASRLTAQTWGSGTSSGSHAYAYDCTGQLEVADGVTYTYDRNGNRTQVGSYTYLTAQPNRTSSDGVYGYTYDNEGNLIGKGKAGETWTFGYDTLDRLTSVQEVTPGGTQYAATYTYDVEGHRVQQDVWTPGTGVVTTRYAFDGLQVWAELSATNVVQTRYLWGDDEAQLLARTDVGVGLRWELVDQLGSVRDVVSADGTTVLDHVEYGPFGTITSETNAANGGSYLFTGLRLDRTTGIMFADERALLVTTGQWMQEDPIQFQAGDANLRRYVGNDPATERGFAN
jgi:RHS repeat-associated protein